MKRGFLSFAILTCWIFLPLFGQTSPQDDPEHWMLAFLDVETTGLTPGFHEVVNVGIILADLEGNEKARMLLYIEPNYPERATPEALAINGYEPKLWRQMGAVPAVQAVDSIIAFYNTQANGKWILMVAYNAQFDASFLDHLFRVADKNIWTFQHYFALDVPSMAWILGYRDLEANVLAKRFGTKGTSRVPIEHHGLGCADLNLRLYRVLMKRAGRKL